MLYLIIPPIIIVISLGILLFLLSKKSSEFSAMQKKENENKFAEKGVIGKVKNADYSRIGHLFLGILEKLVNLFKGIFLKIHQKSDSWMNAIRKKRGKIDMSAIEEKEEMPEKKMSEVVRVKKPEPPVHSEEKEPIPMISEEMVKPEPKVSEKNELEKLLIERIAADPRDLEAYERLGQYYMEQESYRDAKECYKQVLKLSPINRQAKIKLKKITRILGR